MYKHVFLLLIIVVVFSNSLNACSCVWGGNFLKVQKYSDVIILGEIIKFNYYNDDTKEYLNLENFKHIPKERKSMVIEVKRIFKGEEIRKTIEIFGSDGVDCLESLTAFKVGNVYVFAINEYSQKFQSDIGGILYYLSGCSEKWLSYDDETNEVFGWIKGKKRIRKRRITLNKLEEKIK